MAPLSMLESQPGHHRVLQDFLQWADSPDTQKRGRKGKDNLTECTYLPQAALENYLTKARIKALLEALFEASDGSPPDAERVRQHYLRPFATLLSAGHGRMIRLFVEHRNLQDQCLPFTHKPKEFPELAHTDLFKAFYEQQWRFCAVKLEYNMSDRLGPEDILPIEDQIEIGNGGSAILYKITVGEGYEPQTGTATTRPATRVFALKTYRTPEAEEYFKAEREAFVKLRYDEQPHPNIIEYYGSFVREGTYNIILEYADRKSLDEYMRDTDAPTSVQEIMLFWSRFFAILDGLVQIHGTPGTGSQEPHILLGSHQDIDPANILVVSRTQESPYDCDFKIADLGLVHFKRHMSSLSDPTDDERYGTNAYGAPETHRNKRSERSHLQVSQNVDIWSMGCVFSEVAVWVTEGWKKLQEYRRRRKMEVITKDGKYEDRFHCDWKVLDAVKQVHKEIVENSRGNDHVTPAVVTRLIDNMILVNHRHRGSAQSLQGLSARIHGEGESILQQARSRSSAPHPNHTISEGSLDVRRHGLPPQLPPEYRIQVPVASNGIQGDTINEASASRHQAPSSSFDWQAMNGTAQELGSSQRHNRSFTDRPPHAEPPPIRTESNTNADVTNTGQPAPFPSPLRQFHSARPNEPSNGPAATFGRTRREDPGVFETLPQEQAPSPVSTSGTALPDTNDRSSVPQNPRKPYMSVADGLGIKRDRDNGNLCARYPDQGVIEGLDGVLKQRDHAILVDNAASMAEHRVKVKDVLELLSSLAERYDPNGLDLYFTTDRVKHRPKSSQQALQLLNGRPARGMQDLRERFASIIEPYQAQFGKKHRFRRLLPLTPMPAKGPRKLTLFVLTDGKWEGGGGTLIPEITNLISAMHKHNVGSKHIGIQFIRFGNDPKGVERLQELDSGLNLDLDIIDTTSADGNVWKMLLGAVNEWFDGDRD